jgi:trans-aconitate methyltransferase
MTQQWDAAQYGSHGAFVHELAGGVVDLLAPRPGERILDLGCGDGQLTARLAAAGAEVIGIDSSAAMAEAARSRGVQAIVASMEALPFVDTSFDAAFSNAALHWVRDHDRMLAEVSRVLRPGARFAAECGGQGNIAAISTALRAVMARHGYAHLEDGVNYYPSPASYSERLARHGFEVRSMQLIPRPTPLRNSGAGADSGMDGWLRTFRRGVLESLPRELRETVLRETIELLRPALCDEQGNWTADYVRLRFLAVKPS